ncbi:MAG: DNA polymerase III subunit delta [Chloroflexaceae bacterium]|nr:DNA polymerase III subunit delta [Chloroflexaceae bacterium]
MPTYLFWGEDEFSLQKAVDKLRQMVLDPDWGQFNFDKILDTGGEATISALNQAMTPPFGAGGRLVWLADTQLCQQCPEALLTELERTLPAIAPTSTLVLSARQKPDKRLKSTKLLEKQAQIQEFSPISPWKTEELTKQAAQVSQTLGVKLTPAALELLVEAVGNNTRQLWMELEKLQLFAKNNPKPLDEAVVSLLVNATTQTSLQLAAAIRSGNPSRALQILAQLIERNEPALKIVATLVGQFRTWTLVKLLAASGEKDEQIAAIAEVGNPKRLYFLRKEVNSLGSEQLLATLPRLLALELSLKQGGDPLATLEIGLIDLCSLFSGIKSQQALPRCR